jgi:hypothetical protein
VTHLDQSGSDEERCALLQYAMFMLGLADLLTAAWWAPWLAEMLSHLVRELQGR